MQQQGKNAPSELKLEDLLNEEAGKEGDNAKDARGGYIYKLGSYVFAW
jgi:hypothetical protein